MHVHPTRAGDRRGSTVIEASLILMLLLMILCGCLDFGFALFQYQTLVNKARSAARYGAINPSDFTAIQNVALYNSPSIPAGKSEGDPGLFGLKPSMVSVSRLDVGKSEDRIVVALSNYRVLYFGPQIAGSSIGSPITVSLPVEAQ